MPYFRNGKASPTSRSPLPVNPPSPARQWHPEEVLSWCSSRMVVKLSRPLVEATSVPRVNEAEELKVEMMAELVTQSTQERTE